MDEFYNTATFSVSQRKASFNRWIKNPASKQNCEDILKKLDSQNTNERIFYLEALIHFRKTDKLYEILKEGNQVFATKILKQQWFFDEAFQSLPAEHLVNEVMPYFSYVVRKKCLKRLSLCWPQEKIDALYDAVYTRYGLAAAIPLLHKCSLSKLKAVLKEDEIKLTPNQVIQLFEKNQEFFIYYVEYHKRVLRSLYSVKKVIDYIALKNPGLLLELRDEGKLKIAQLGRRTTKYVIKVKKDIFYENSNKYVDCFNKKVLVNRLGQNFQAVFKKELPVGFPQISSGVIQFPEGNSDKYKLLLIHYPRKLRWQLFYQIYVDKFPNNSLETLLLASSKCLIELLCPPISITQKWAKIKYENEEKDSYIPLFSLEESIVLLKKNISLTKNYNRREDYLELLIECCAEYKDLKALEEILKYIVDKHKLERASALENIIRLTFDKFKADNLQEKHWEYINELFKIIAVSDRGNIYCKHEYGRYLKFLLNNEKNTRENIISLIEATFVHNPWSLIDIGDKSAEKKIYTEVCKLLSEVNIEGYPNWSENFSILMKKIFEFCLNSPKDCIELQGCVTLQKYITSLFGDQHDVERYNFEFVVYIVKYNQTFPENALKIDNEALLDFCVRAYSSDDYRWSLWDLLPFVINKKNRTDFANKLLVKYFEVIYKEHPDNKVISWLLKHEPKTLMPYLDVILTNCFSSSSNYNLDNDILKIYSHVDWIQRVKDQFYKHIAELSNEDTEKVGSFLISVYPLLTTEEFINIVEQRFVPKEDKLDIKNKEMCDMYKSRCDVAAILGNIDEPYKMLPTIMKFARGDYLQSALPSLYRAFYKSPERLLYSYVEQLNKQAVSARKHALHLSCAVLDKGHVVHMLNTTKFANMSSQKYFFTALLKYFVKNPSQDLFEKFLDNLKTVDKFDSETLTSLISLPIPEKYKSRYIHACWYFFEGLELTVCKKAEYLKQFLSYVINVNLNTIPLELVTYIIKKYFVKDASIRLSNINNFVIKALNDTQIFSLVFDILLTLDRKWINVFFDAFIDSALKNEVDRVCVNLFSEFWFGRFNRLEHLQSDIKFKLLMLKLDHALIEDFACNVVQYMDQLITEFGPFVLKMFREQLTNILLHIPNENRPTFYLTVLSCKADINTCIFVLETMLDADKDEYIDITSEYGKVLEIIKNVDIPIVQAFYTSWLIKHNKNEPKQEEDDMFGLFD